MLVARASGPARLAGAQGRAATASLRQDPGFRYAEASLRRRVAGLSPANGNRNSAVVPAAKLNLGASKQGSAKGVASEARFINGVRVTDRATGKVLQGTVDLKPTLDRIAAGTKLSHRNDGAVFGNREGRLPKQPAGYYREFVHPTPGVNGPGPQRIVTGRGGEVFYTPDHYGTFIPVRP